ncbi:MAG: GFA family protein [Hyphomicrobiaceae bacterium]
MAEGVFAKGRCLCGSVVFSVRAGPVMTGQCHCKDCQRASGTGHMSLAFFKADDVMITRGTARFAVKADSGNTVERAFCPKCGSRMFAQNSSRSGVIGIAVGAMDNSDWFKADRIVYTKDQPPWDLTATDIPRFEKMPPPKPSS